MAKTVAQLMSEFQADPWRQQVGFSTDIQAAHQSMFNSSAEDCRCHILKVSQVMQ